MKNLFAKWRKRSSVDAEGQDLEKVRREVDSNYRVTPNMITMLKPGEVFVFGSNADGMHYGGAALTAMRKFGAKLGQGHGMQGDSYAIDTMSGIDEMRRDVDDFITYAKEHPERRFLVTLVGCGIAGMTPEEVAPMFAKCADIQNVCLPAEFWSIIGKPEKYDLQRFVDAQDEVYEMALDELRSGRKRNHWVWFIFPQQKGLGYSYYSQYHGLDGEKEAKAYLANDKLAHRLRECCEALLSHRKDDIEQIMGSEIDAVKLRSSMRLFDCVSPNDVFAKVLKAFYKN